MKRFLTLALTALVALPAVASAQAQNCNTNACTMDVTTNVTVPAVATTLNLSQTAVTLTAPAAGLTGSVTDMAVWTYSLTSNSTWTVQVQAPGATMTPGGGSTYNKPVGNLSWSTAAAAPTTTLTTTLASVDSGTGNKTATNFNVAQAYANDMPGTYAGVFRFRLTSP